MQTEKWNSNVKLYFSLTSATVTEKKNKKTSWINVVVCQNLLHNMISLKFYHVSYLHHLCRLAFLFWLFCLLSRILVQSNLARVRGAQLKNFSFLFCLEFCFFQLGLTIYGNQQPIYGLSKNWCKLWKSKVFFEITQTDTEDGGKDSGGYSRQSQNRSQLLPLFFFIITQLE